MAQKSDLGAWYNYIGSMKMDSSFNWHQEIQYRNYNAIGDLEQLLLRTGIGYNLSEKNNNVLLGYAFVYSENYSMPNDVDKVNTSEHRVFQQFITRQAFKIGALQHRYRFEQRFLGEDFKLRFRYLLGANIPLGIAVNSERPFYLSAYNEVFLHTRNEVFDRNRTYAAIGYKVHKILNLELGYMNQFLASSGRDQVMVTTFMNF